MSSYSSKKAYLVGKLETTAGTAETLADADFDTRVSDIEVSPEWMTSEYAFANGGYNASAGTAGTASIGFTFNSLLCPSGTPATVEPNNWKFAKACGWSGVTYGTTGVALQDLPSADQKTMTIEKIDVERGATPTGIADQGAGCYGNMVLSAEVGSPITMGFTFNGKHTENATVSNANLYALTAADTSVAPSFKGVTATLGGTAICVKSIQLDLGIASSPELCASDATGILTYKKDTQTTNHTISFLMPTLATYDPYSKWSSETAEELVIVDGDFTITIPQLQLTAAPKADGSGSVVYNGTFKALRNGGANANLDDEASIEILQGARTA